MKKAALSIVVTLWTSSAYSLTPFWHSDSFSVDYALPPTIVYFVDSQGRRTGTDPNKPTDDATGGGTNLTEIPKSKISRQNTGDDSGAGEDNPQTDWSAVVYDGGAQTYTVHVIGTTTAVADVYLGSDAPVAAGKTSILTKIQFLVASGMEQLLVVQVNRKQDTLVATRVVTATQLEESVGIACKLGFIAPEGICQSLQAKAQAAADAVVRGDSRAAAGDWTAFLNELQAQGNKHIKKPVVTILREEAQTLLNGLSGKKAHK